jgi:hypothetical protein
MHDARASLGPDRSTVDLDAVSSSLVTTRPPISLRLHSGRPTPVTPMTRAYILLRPTIHESIQPESHLMTRARKITPLHCRASLNCEAATNQPSMHRYKCNDRRRTNGRDGDGGPAGRSPRPVPSTPGPAPSTSAASPVRALRGPLARRMGRLGVPWPASAMPGTHHSVVPVGRPLAATNLSSAFPQHD